MLDLHEAWIVEGESRWKTLCERMIKAPLDFGLSPPFSGGFAATFYSFLASCKAHDINPQGYLYHIIENTENIATFPINRIHELLPKNYNKQLSFRAARSAQHEN